MRYKTVVDANPDCLKLGLRSLGMVSESKIAMGMRALSRLDTSTAQSVLKGSPILRSGCRRPSGRQ